MKESQPIVMFKSATECRISKIKKPQKSQKQVNDELDDLTEIIKNTTVDHFFHTSPQTSLQTTL